MAILELFSNRFEKLQDAMGAKLFPLALKIAKEPNEFPAFIEKLNRLEKIGAIPFGGGMVINFLTLNQANHHEKQ